MLLLPAADKASANAGDVFGFGSRASGMAGAQTAVASDFSAAYYNPAGLAFNPAPEVDLDLLYYSSGLKINGQPYGIADPFGVVLGASATLPFRRWLSQRLHFGVATYLPSTMVHLIAHAPADAYYPLYDNRTQRLTVMPALAVTVIDGLSVGASLNFGSSLTGQIKAREGVTREVGARVIQELGTEVSPQLGLRWQPWGWLAFGAAYRAEFSLPFKIQTTNYIADGPVNLDLRAEAFYTPPQVAFGIAARPFKFVHPALDGFLWAVDFTYRFWSAYPGSFVNLAAQLPPLGGVAVDLISEPQTPEFSNTLDFRLGAEYPLPIRPWFTYTPRLGFGYEASPVPAQPGGANLLDGGRVQFAWGSGFTFFTEPYPLTLDIHVRLQLIGEVTYQKNPELLPDEDTRAVSPGWQTSNMGYPTITGGGTIFDAGAGVSVNF